MALSGCLPEVPIEITGPCDKKASKDFINKNIIPAVCALLNSEGGMIKVSVVEMTLDPRSVEQMVINLIGVSAFCAYVKVKEGKCARNGYEILIYVKRSEHFITVNYNLYFPTQKQIPAVETTDYINRIRKLLHQKIVEDFVEYGSHQKEFVLGEESRLQESDVIQLKSLKSEKSIKAKAEDAAGQNLPERNVVKPSAKEKSTTFVKRMLTEKNKFSNYISGFANHRGGHIYYGIDDKGVVTGENLTKEDINEVREEVPKAINKLIWTEGNIAPQKGVNWDIYFEQVSDKNDREVESTYVVVVFVASCQGGVFTAEPESYYIKDKKVILLWLNGTLFSYLNDL